MSSPTALNTPTIVSQRGDRTTGSPLLDSFVLSPKANNTAYISPEFAKRSTANAQKAQSRRANAEAQLKLHSLPLASSSAQPPQSSAAVQSPPALPESRKAPVPLVDKQATVKADKKVVTPAPVSSAPDPTSEQPSSNQSSSNQSSSDEPSQPLSSQNLSAPKTPAPKMSAPAASVAKASATKPAARKRLPNPSLERAAAVGMLDLSDKLLFGGEDDALISDYLGGDDPLMTGEDETAVLNYLSKQIVDSQLAKIKGRLPLSTQPQPQIDPNKIVLDAKNFKVFADAVLKVDSSMPDVDNQPSKNNAAQADASTSESLSMSEQIALLNQKVELLTQELSTLTAAAPQAMTSQPAVLSANETH